VALCAAVCVYAQWRLLRTPRPTDAAQAVFLLSAAALPYLHTFAALLLVPLAAQAVYFAKARARRRIFTLLALAAALYLPWAAVTLRALVETRAASPAPTLNALQLLGAVAAALANGALILIAFLPLAALLFWFHPYRRRAGFAYIAFVCGAYFTVCTVANLFVPAVLHSRYLIALWPLVAALVGCLFAVPVSVMDRLIVTVYVVVGVTGIFSANHFDEPFGADAVRYFRRHLRPDQVAASLRVWAQPGDVLLLSSEGAPGSEEVAWQPFDHYLRGVPALSGAAMLQRLPGSVDDGLFAQFAALEVGKARRVWLAVDWRLPDAERLPLVQDALRAADYRACPAALDTGGLALYLYAAPDADLECPSP
jgi:hypothetical protein